MSNSIRQKIGQQIIIGISGHSLTDDEKRFIVENNISGVCLFGRNVSEPKQVHALCSEIQSLRKLTTEKTPLFISIDMEGGRVARLKAPFTIWPPLKKIGDHDSATLAFDFTLAMGKELKAVGINLDFAPCVDIYTNPKNTVIGDRSLSSNPEVVNKLSSALVRGYLKADVIPCAKHFPGHGNTLIDSHLDLPIEEASLERLEEVEIQPFKKAIKAHCQMIMMAHIRFKNIDPDWPATLSEIFIKQILRERVNYKGLVITDDLDMKALASYYDKKEIPVRALKAGANLLLYCNEPDSPPTALEAIQQALEKNEITQNLVEENYKKILNFKSEHIKNPDPLSLVDAIKIIGHPDHLKLAQEIAK